MLRAILLALLTVAAASAQPRPAYEVASIKLNTSGTNGTSSRGSKGQIVYSNMPLKRLIERAWSLQASQVAGPDWLESVRFDIAAKYPEETQDSDRLLMLQTLLQNSFKLSFHRETRDLAGYGLLVAKGGLKVKPVEPGPSGTDSMGGTVVTLKARRISMAQLSSTLARQLGEIVVDQTALTGVYDFELSWTRDDQKANSADAEAPSLFTALPATLGVRLQAKKLPIEVLVVDHMERAPIEN